MHAESAVRESTRPAPAAFNALKHGLYAASVLLPGEDAAAFQRHRRALFHTYRPQTKDEADLVDAMAEHRWVSRRFRAVQAWFDEQAVTPETDGAGRVCEPIAHQRLHSGMDVSVHRQRVDKQWHRARAWLVAMQKQRRQGLVDGAVALPKDCYMETDGRVYGPIAPKVIVPIPEPEIDTDEPELSASSHAGNGEYREQNETGRDAVRPTASGARRPRGFAAPIGFAEAPGAATADV